MRTTTISKLRGFPALIALLSAGAVTAPGCGGDDNPQPAPIVIGSGGDGATGGKGASGGSGGTGVGGEGGEGNEGSGATGGTEATGGTSGGRAGSGGATGGGGKGGSGNAGKGGSGSAGKGGSGNAGKGGSGGTTPEVDCDQRPDGCYRCEPQAIDPEPAWPHSPNEQFLNRCSDARGWPFDNATRIPNFPGTDNLPTLP